MEQIYSNEIGRAVAKRYVCSQCWGGLSLQATDLTFESVKVYCQSCGDDKGLVTRGFINRLLRQDLENYYLASRNLKGLLDQPKLTIETEVKSMAIKTIRKQMLFPPLGSIRKGQAKDEADGFPEDLDYFRFVFNPGEELAAAAAEKVYGKEPKEIRVTLPFSDTTKLWDYWLKAYAGGRCIAVSDGEKFLYWLDNETNEVKARNGIMLATGEPADYYDNMLIGITYSSRKPIYCTPIGKLTVILPDISSTVSRLAPLQVYTKSWNDIAHITNLLEWYGAISEESHIPLAGCEMLLRREWREVSYNQGRNKVKKSLITLDIIDPRWKDTLWKTIQERAFGVADIANPYEYSLPDEAYLDTGVVNPDNYTPPSIPKVSEDVKVQKPIPEPTSQASSFQPKDKNDYQSFYTYARGHLGMDNKTAYHYLSEEAGNDAIKAFNIISQSFITQDDKKALELASP